MPYTQQGYPAGAGLGKVGQYVGGTAYNIGDIIYVATAFGGFHVCIEQHVSVAPGPMPMQSSRSWHWVANPTAQ